MSEIGTLFVVATPIGNLEDITLRALRVLKESAVIACEDTRVTRKLCSAHGIATPLVSHHAHSSDASLQRLTDRLLGGEDVALVSDAGTPLLSDPGAQLVQDVLQHGVPVVALPGASALLTALVPSGLCPQPFTFLGFLPRKSGDRARVLAPFINLPATLIIYEASQRVVPLLEHLLQLAGDRQAVVARELSKLFEEFARGSLSELVERCTAQAPRGEVVVLLAPSHGEGAAIAGDVDEHILRLRAAGERTGDIAKVIAGAHGLAKQEVYKRVLALESDPTDEPSKQ